MMERLAVEESLPARRVLLESLVACGTAAVPLLTGFLGDGRWFVVRNAISILGEIRAPEAAASLPPLLHHRDIRVAREAIRALTRIGGSRAVGILLQLVEAENQELSRHALLSLGATKNQAAVPTLLKLVNRPDPLVKEAELKKGAIKALGEIGAAEAVPALASLLGRKKWWRRSLFDQVRAAAASALGEIGGTAPIPALERAAEDRSPVVARAAAYSLKQIRKGE
jgi:HEAT repeat protein